MANSPFAKRTSLEPGKILITFLAEVPGKEARDKLTALKDRPEELHLKGRELYIYFPDGVSKSKLPWSQVERLLNVTGTARNLNSCRAGGRKRSAIRVLRRQPSPLYTTTIMTQ